MQEEVSLATRVLVIEADPAQGEATRDALRWGACEVSIASTAEEALAASLVVRPHVVIVGASVAAAMGELLQRGVFPSTPVIAFSRGDSVPVADAVLAIPVDALELLATVRMLAACRELQP